MARYRFAREIRGETKVTGFINASDFFFLIFYLSAVYSLKTYVHEDFRMMYYIFSVICAITLTMPSPINHGRRMYKSLFIYIQRDESRYRPIRRRRKKCY